MASSPPFPVHNTMRIESRSADGAGLAMDPYYRYEAPHPWLIRITGGQRYYTTGNLTTFYSWTLAYHPQNTADNSRPDDVVPLVRGGAKNADVDVDSWWALEASGNDTVPTDGSAVVLAWPSPSQDFLIFHYEREILGEIIAKHTTGSTTWYSWKEVEPGARVTAGHNFDDKPAQAIVGNESSGIRNPLFEINQRADVAVGTIVRVFAYPVRANTSGSGGYLRERPEAVITETAHCDPDLLVHTTQRVKWYGTPTGGSFKLRVTNAAGTVGTSNAINISDNAAAIDTAIVASGVVTAVTVTGNGDNFTVQFDDNYLHFPPVEVVTNDTNTVYTDLAYFFDASMPVVTIDDSNTPTSFAGPLNTGAIYVYQKTGITLGQHSGSGTKGLRLLAATPTQQGAVSTVAQEWAGNKTIYGTDFILQDATSAPYSKALLRSTYQSLHFTRYTDADNFEATTFEGNTGPDGLGFRVYQSLAVSGVGTLQTLSCESDGTDTVLLLSGKGTPRFAVLHSLTQYDGVTGSVAGLSFKGGIVTTVPTDLAYTPTTSGDWNGTAPTTIKAALDRCAALLKTLNGGTGP